jgi:tetratricopeptide (TPR) repeat protein
MLGKLGRLDEARAAARDVIPRNPQEQALQTMTEAAILREAGRHQEALEVLEQGLKRQPDHPELLYDFSMAAERLDRLPDAERALRRLIELRPDHAHAFNALGYSLAERNLRLPEARSLIEQALRLAPDDAQIIDSMGWVLFRLQDYPGALMHLRRAYALLPDPEIAAHLGEALWVSGQRDEARQVWRAALAKDPQNPVLRATVTRLNATP